MHAAVIIVWSSRWDVGMRVCCERPCPCASVPAVMCVIAARGVRCRRRAASCPHVADSVHGSSVAVQVDMYKVVESWRTMERPLFVSIMHLLLYTKHIGSEGALEQYQTFVRMLARDYQEACGHAASDLTPFDQYPGYVKKVRMYIKASPLGGVRKITPLTPGQIKRAVENMYVGGFSMLQVRASAVAVAYVPLRYGWTVGARRPCEARQRGVRPAPAAAAR